jgi:hypothetical protein
MLVLRRRAFAARLPSLMQDIFRESLVIWCAVPGNSKPSATQDAVPVQSRDTTSHSDYSPILPNRTRVVTRASDQQGIPPPTDSAKQSTPQSRGFYVGVSVWNIWTNRRTIDVHQALNRS